MMPVDIDAVTALLRAVAQAEILPRFRRLRDGESWEKRSGAVVTVADERAEAALSEALAAMLPGSAVVAEEAAEAAPETLDALNRPGAVWVIDPIDGTANFSEGKACFAVMVALVVDGEAAAGWIYDPVADAAAVVERGGGAWRDGARLRSAAPAPEAEMTGAFGWRLNRDKGFSGRFRARTYNKCCGFDYLALAEGRTHFAFYRSLKPWDHAAGQLLHAEAGGYNACVDGTPYRPGRKQQEGLLLAPDADIWAGLADRIRRSLGI
ncbi:MAG: inositol monophosphatase [Defluviicoccus sp.]|nr:inositol monophosphatase [Defluviicoccus sp.]